MLATLVCALGVTGCFGNGEANEPEATFEPEFVAEPDDCGGGCEDHYACFDGECIRDGTCSENEHCFPYVCNVEFEVCDLCYPSQPCDVGNTCQEDGVCAPIPFSASGIDFETEIVPLFEAAACVTCHNTDAPTSVVDLVFDVTPDALYEQLLLPDRNRVLPLSPRESLVITKPRREDPPDHPVGIWDEDGPEVDQLMEWISDGAARRGRCHAVPLPNGDTVDCVTGYEAENYCSVYLPDDPNDRAAFNQCPLCDPQFATAPAGVVCGGADGGSLEEGGSADGGNLGLDAGHGVDSGVPARPDAGAADAGPHDAGQGDAG